MPHEGRLSVCVTCRIHTDAAMLRGAISLSIFWKPIDGQRRGLTHFGLKPARRDGSAVLDSVDTYKCPPEAPKEAVTSTRSVHGHHATAGTFRGRIDIQSPRGQVWESGPLLHAVGRRAISARC